jgi:hypothetical protein
VPGQGLRSSKQDDDGVDRRHQLLLALLLMSILAARPQTLHAFWLQLLPLQRENFELGSEQVPEIGSP